MAWSEGLNDEQRDAITSEYLNGCVIAGPGTGKTRTLLRKALQLVQEQEVPAHRLRIVNFTNAGVSDLINSVQSNEEYRVIDTETITTFHSLALRALTRTGARSVPKPLVILDDWEERTFVDEFAKSRLQLKNINQAKKIRDDYNARWCIASEDASEWLSEGTRMKFEEVYRSAKDVLGFTAQGELTFLWWRYLRSITNHDEFSLGVDADYILVDEYQDLNECEHEILQILAENGIGIFAVGDPNQSIYETMRHAHPEFCWDFRTKIAPAEITVLDRSYRCSKSVLNFGRALMGSVDGIPDPRYAKQEGEAKILFFPRGDAEMNGIVLLTESLLNPDSTLLIAVPSRRIAADFAKAFQQRNMDHENRAKEDSEPPVECRLARALRSLLKNRQDSVAAATAIVLRCARTTRRQRVVELIDTAYQKSTPVATLLNSKTVIGGPLGKAIEKVRTDLNMLQNADDVDELLASMTGCHHESDNAVSYSSSAPKPLEPGKATIMTLHSCKGLEADIAILPAVEPGSYERNMIGAEKEEARRLLYVGITRAVDKVFLTFAARRYGQTRYGDPTGTTARKQASVFIDDICDRLRVKPQSGGEYLRGLLKARDS